MSMIDYEISYPDNPHFVFHHPRGIAAGAESNSRGTEAEGEPDSSQLRVDFIQQFINDRAQRRHIGDQLHAIW